MVPVIAEEYLEPHQLFIAVAAGGRQDFGEEQSGLDIRRGIKDGVVVQARRDLA